MIALRLNFTDVLREGTFRSIFANGKKIGCKFDVRLSYYRGHFLSAIDELRVIIDGEEVPQKDIFLELRGKQYAVSQLPELGNVFWPIAEAASINIFKKGGYENGEHEVELILFFRSPYMELGPRFYMPNDSGDKKTLVLE